MDDPRHVLVLTVWGKREGAGADVGPRASGARQAGAGCALDGDFRAWLIQATHPKSAVLPGQHTHGGTSCGPG